MILYGLKNCDTCRKALKSLNIARFVDVRAEGVPEVQLLSAYAQFGRALLNTRSTTWRNLPQAERDRDPLELLSDHPTLMKRPLIVDEGGMYLGWSPQTRVALGVD